MERTNGKLKMALISCESGKAMFQATSMDVVDDANDAELPVEVKAEAHLMLDLENDEDVKDEIIVLGDGTELSMAQVVEASEKMRDLSIAILAARNE